jgi:hypothetical protein
MRLQHAEDASDDEAEAIQRTAPPATTLSLDLPDEDSDNDDDVEFEVVGGEADMANAPKPMENIEIVLEKAPVVESKRKGAKCGLLLWRASVP